MITQFTATADTDFTPRARIETTGSHTVFIVQCNLETTPRGAEVVRLYFREGSTDKGAPDGWARIYLTKNNGEVAFGFNLFQSILACAGVAGAAATKATYYTMKGEQVEGYRVRGIEGKRVGLVLQRRFYLDKDGNERFELVVRKAFNPTTSQTASEMKEGAKATVIEGLVKTLTDDRSQIDNNSFETCRTAQPEPQAPATSYRPAQGYPEHGISALSEDCPF